MTIRYIIPICKGNICRSPMAEAILKHLIDEMNLSEYFQVRSFGMSNCCVGDPPERKALKILRLHRIANNITGKVAEQFQSSKLDSDKLYTLIAMEPNIKHKLFHDEYGLSSLADITNLFVDDPVYIKNQRIYMKDLEDFRFLYNDIYKGCVKILGDLI